MIPMIHPYFLYCNVVWGGACKLAINKLFVSKNVPFACWLIPYFVLTVIRFLYVLKLTDIYKLQIGLFVYNSKHDLLPISSSRHVQPARLNCRFSFNVKFDFKGFDCRTLVRERYIGIIGPKLWNILPQAIRDANSVFLFKKKLKDYLVGLYI